MYWGTVGMYWIPAKPGVAEAMSLVNYVSGCFATYPCATVFIRAHGRKATVYLGERDGSGSDSAAAQIPRDFDRR